MRELKKITLLLALASAPWALIAIACGVASDDSAKVVTESGTGELDEGPPCAVGVNNHKENGTCYCDEGFTWCDENTSLDCCPE